MSTVGSYTGGFTTCDYALLSGTKAADDFLLRKVLCREGGRI
jgi:hypothetical protein